MFTLKVNLCMCVCVIGSTLLAPFVIDMGDSPNWVHLDMVRVHFAGRHRLELLRCFYNNVPNGYDCDDGVFYTLNDSCQDGVCLGIADYCLGCRQACFAAWQNE